MKEIIKEIIENEMDCLITDVDFVIKKEGSLQALENMLEKAINYAHSSTQLPCYKDLNIEMKKVSEKLDTDFKQTEKNYFEAGFSYCHHIIEEMLNK